MRHTLYKMLKVKASEKVAGGEPRGDDVRQDQEKPSSSSAPLRVKWITSITFW